MQISEFRLFRLYFVCLLLKLHEIYEGSVAAGCLAPCLADLFKMCARKDSRMAAGGGGAQRVPAHKYFCSVWLLFFFCVLFFHIFLFCAGRQVLSFIAACLRFHLANRIEFPSMKPKHHWRPIKAAVQVHAG